MNKKLFILSLILVFTFLLRVWHIISIPPGLNRDEAAIGYNAYSLLLTGKDEYGASFPISLKSFGDWKLPLYIYTDIPFIKLFSLNEFSVRFPSILFGTLTVVLVYITCRKLFEFHSFRSRISLLAAFFLAISPWHIHFSRVTSEANLSAFLVFLGFCLFVYGQSRIKMLIVSSIILSLSLYAYHGSHIFSLILYLGMVLFLVNNRISKKQILSFVIPFLSLAAIIYFLTLNSADKTKISGLTPLSDQYLVYENTVLRRLDYSDPNALVSRVFQNKYVYLVNQVMVNYLRGFSVDFLFVRGGGNLQHNIPGFGNFYIWDAFFIVCGIYYLLKSKNPWRYLLLYWLLISPIPSAITKDAPHSARMFALLPMPQILMAFGFWEILHMVKVSKMRRFTGNILLMLLTVNFAVFMNKYFIHFPKISESVWGNGYTKLVTEMTEIQSGYREIIMDRPNYSPYIYFLFYNKTDPALFQKEALRYPDDSEGFSHVEKIGNLSFKKIDWGSLEYRLPGNLLVAYPDSLPASATNSSILVDGPVLMDLQAKFGGTYGLKIGDYLNNQLVGKIALDNGQPFVYLIRTIKISSNIQQKTIRNLP